MSNATVSSQVYIIRNAGSLSAVATGTMVLYADGTDLFAKDAAGNVYNLTSIGAGSVSLAIDDLTDVEAGSATDGQVLQFDGTDWNAVTLSTALNDLSDVSTSGATSGQVLQYNGASWVAATVSGGAALAGLFDVADVYDYDAGTAPADGQGLVWDNANTRWAPTDTINSFTVTDGNNTFTVDDGAATRFTAGTGLTSVATTGTKQIQYSLSANASDLSDVTYTTPTTGDVLQWSGTAWTNSGISIDELSDVDTTTVAPTDGQALVWDNANSKWEPGTINSSTASPFTIKRFQLIPFDYVATAGTGSMAIGSTATPPKQAYFDEVFTDSSPDSDSLMVISLFPTFQAKPTMTDNGDDGSLTLKISGASISETFVVELVGSVKSGGTTYNSAAVSLNCAFTSSTSATVTISAANIDALTPNAIMTANTQSDADFEEWSLTFTIKTFQGNITTRTLSVDTLNIPVEM